MPFIEYREKALGFYNCQLKPQIIKENVLNRKKDFSDDNVWNYLNKGGYING